MKHKSRAMRLGAATLAAAAAAIAAGCASTRVDAQWIDPQRSVASLAGTRVLLACQAQDITVQRVCTEQLALQASQRGLQPLPVNPPTRLDEPQVLPSPAELLNKARGLGAQSVLQLSVSPDVLVATPGPSIGVGVGGFGGGWGHGHGGGGMGVGLGVGFPIGGPAVNAGYGARATLSDVATGRPIWSANASTPASADVGEQLSQLTQALLEAAAKAGLF